MLRIPLVSLLSLALTACAGKESPPPATDATAPSGPAANAASGDPVLENPDMNNTWGAEVEACQGLLLPDDVSLRHTGQGSHAAAATDRTIDLKTGRMTGSDYTLDADGNTPIALSVDQQVSPEAMAVLRERFDNTCAPRRKADKQEHSAPGGSSMIEVTHADGSSLFVVTGSSNLAAGALAAEVAREDWLALFEAWPATDGK